MTVALHIDNLPTIDSRFHGLVAAGAILQDWVLEQVVNSSESVFLHRQLYVSWSWLDDVGVDTGLAEHREQCTVHVNRHETYQDCCH